MGRLTVVDRSDFQWHGAARSHLKFEVQRLFSEVAAEASTNDSMAIIPRDDSRIIALTEQLARSQADLESTSARFNELASMVPSDIAMLSDRLTGILNAAMAEAEEIRADAHRFAETVRIKAEERAARIVAEANVEYDAAAQLRSDMQAQNEQIRGDIERLREHAIRAAANTLSEANKQAEEMLTRVHRDVDAQLALAQEKLDLLIHTRAKIVAQLNDFYDNFVKLDDSMEPGGSARPITLISTTSAEPSTCGAHASEGIGAATERLDDVG